MKKIICGIAMVCLFSASAYANMCDKVRDLQLEQDSTQEVSFFQQLFTENAFHGNNTWNKMVLECNRKRDGDGNKVRKAIIGNSGDRSVLQQSDLSLKLIRGKYNFFGTVLTQQKYSYLLKKTNGIWEMIIPYKAVFNEVVPNRVDFDMGVFLASNSQSATRVGVGVPHARKLFDESQVRVARFNRTSTSSYVFRTPHPLPISETKCAFSTYFPGKEGKYDRESDADSYKRDNQNKFISLGKTQYRFKDQTFWAEGCRVDKSEALYYMDNVGNPVRVMPQDWILDNFAHAAEMFWSEPGNFRLRLLFKGYNESEFGSDVLNALGNNDYITIRIANEFLPHHYREMYKSNPVGYNNFSTMTFDGTIKHEVGHAFGLDDEYGRKDTKEGSCLNNKYSENLPESYIMCGSAPADIRTRTIYHYIAISRYIAN